MQVLKGIALGMTGFFLFIVLPLLGLALALNQTVLNPNFVTREIKKLDISTIAQELIEEQLPVEYQSYTPELKAAVVEVEPWLEQEIDSVVSAGYDYLLGNTGDFNITINLDPIRQPLINHLSAAYLQSPPGGAAVLSPAEIRQEIEATLPAGSTIEINSEVLGAETMDSLDTARQIIGYVHIGYIVLWVLIAVFILLIVLILRDLKGIGLTLGIIFLISGVLTLVTALATKYFMRTAFVTADLPVHVQGWVPGLINDLFYPTNIFSLAVLIIGVLMMVVFFLYRRNQPVPASHTMLKSES
jgi:hypothetical protein